jgi:hypothetical protein
MIALVLGVYFFFNFRRVYVRCAGVYIGKYGSCPGMDNGVYGRAKGHCGGNHFIAMPQVQGEA